MDDRKLKVYLDTSVISHLWQIDAPEKMQETLALWEEFKKGKFDIYISLLTIEEVNGCSEIKRNELSEYLKQIEYKVLDVTYEAILIVNNDNANITYKKLRDASIVYYIDKTFRRQNQNV